MSRFVAVFLLVGFLFVTLISAAPASAHDGGYRHDHDRGHRHYSPPARGEFRFRIFIAPPLQPRYHYHAPPPPPVFCTDNWQPGQWVWSPYSQAWQWQAGFWTRECR